MTERILTEETRPYEILMRFWPGRPVAAHQQRLWRLIDPATGEIVTEKALPAESIDLGNPEQMAALSAVIEPQLLRDLQAARQELDNLIALANGEV